MCTVRIYLVGSDSVWENSMTECEILKDVESRGYAVLIKEVVRDENVGGGKLLKLLLEKDGKQYYSLPRVGE